MKKNSIQALLGVLTPKAKAGALPIVTACPYCGRHMSQTAHAAHQPLCKRAFRLAPPQAAEFSQDPGGGYNADGTFPQT